MFPISIDGGNRFGVQMARSLHLVETRRGKKTFLQSKTFLINLGVISNFVITNFKFAAFIIYKAESFMNIIINYKHNNKRSERSNNMNSFRKGLIVGGLIGASITMISNSDMMNGRNRKKMIKTGRSMMRRTGSMISDIVDVFR
jgi:hypothetical protein